MRALSLIAGIAVLALAAPAGAEDEGQTGKLLLVERGTAVDGERRFDIKLRCPASNLGGRCLGDVNVRRKGDWIAGRSYNIRAERWREVSLQLGKREYHRLLRRERMRVRLFVRTRDTDGTLRSVDTRMALIAPIEASE